MSSTPQPKRRRRAVLTAAIAAAALAVAAGTALAAVATIPATSPVGSAGYEATTASPAGFTDSQAVVNADQYGLTVKNDNAQGVFLCDTSTGLAAQVGEVSTNSNTTYEVVSVLGNPAGGCPNNGIAPGAVIFPGLATVPFGHHVWTHAFVTKKTKVIRILVCILFDKHNGHPVPTPSPSVANPIVTPSASPSAANPTASASPSAANPTASPSESPSVSPVEGSPEQLPVIPGVVFRCHIVTRTIVKNVVTFEAQDLDAPTVTPLAGDAPGVQVRSVRLPRGTVFDSAGVGVTGNLTTLSPCTGAGFPLLLAGPASYTSRACQPLNVMNYATAAIGGGPAQGYDALTTTEVISPNSSAAIMAPNNSLQINSVGPHGTASDASTAGSQFTVFSGNAPTS